MDVGEFNGGRLYTVHRLDYRLWLWAPTSASCTVSSVGELLVLYMAVLMQMWPCGFIQHARCTF